MKDRCGSCIHRADPKMKGCKYSDSPEHPIIPHLDEICVFIKREGKSRWEPKPELQSRVVKPMDDSNPYPAGAGPIFSPTPKPSGYSMVCRQMPNGGQQKFLLKDGKCYNVETKEYICDLADMNEKEPTEAELEEAVKWVKKLNF